LTPRKDHDRSSPVYNAGARDFAVLDITATIIAAASLDSLLFLIYQKLCKGEEQMAKDATASGQVNHPENLPLPSYVSPKVITYTSEEIEEQIGPVLMCSPAPACVAAP
jgi:hypothetical protein